MTSISSFAISNQSPSMMTKPSIKVGDRNSFVKELQKTLTNKGYNPSSNIDGIFGKKTLQAVRSYQLSTSISNPRGNFYGVAGPQTLSSLGLLSASPEVATTAPARAEVNQPKAASTNSVSDLFATAKNYIGTKYQWGGTSSKGFDCSGFIQHVFNKHGKNTPRTVAEMWKQGTHVSSPKEGDLVFFETRKGPSHAGIYLGNNKFIHSGASTGVTITDMNNPYWKARYLGAKEL